MIIFAFLMKEIAFLKWVVTKTKGKLESRWYQVALNFLVDCKYFREEIMSIHRNIHFQKKLPEVTKHRFNIPWLLTFHNFSSIKQICSNRWVKPILKISNVINKCKNLMEDIYNSTIELSIPVMNKLKTSFLRFQELHNS